MLKAFVILLREVHTNFHTLECRGYVEEIQNGRCGFVFTLPQPVQQALNTTRESTASEVITAPTVSKTTVVTLLDKLNNSNLEKPDLETRFRVAFTIAEAILRLHTAGWLHKGVRSEHVLFLKASATR